MDTDFGFDDLWAILLLRHLNVQVDGVSLVAGNTPLFQVIKNAAASKKTFDFEWPMYVGASRPLQREPETAQRILGSSGMRSRGLELPEYFLGTKTTTDSPALDENAAVAAMASWLHDNHQQHVLALGPLTNIALLLKQYPEVVRNISKLTWMGGSGGRGNHSQSAEYNALADPEALAAVACSAVTFRMIDLEVCRQVTFNESDMPVMKGRNKQLLSDLLGGYLDIALHRGRSAMAIYDPVAALAVGASDLFEFVPATLGVNTHLNEHYGQTVFSDVASSASLESVQAFEYAPSIDSCAARNLCFEALQNA